MCDKKLVRRDAWILSMKRSFVRSLGPHCQRQEGAIEDFLSRRGVWPDLYCRTITLLCGEGGQEQGSGQGGYYGARAASVGMAWNSRGRILLQVGLCHMPSALLPPCLSIAALPAWNTSSCCHQAGSFSSWSHTQRGPP